MHPDGVLVKTSTDNSRWQTERCSDDQNSWTSKVIYKKHPLGQRVLRMASAFLGKYTSVGNILVRLLLFRLLPVRDLQFRLLLFHLLYIFTSNCFYLQHCY